MVLWRAEPSLSIMLALQGLDHVTVTSNDPEKSIRFYTEVLGLERGLEWPGEITMLRCGGSCLAIARWATGKGRGPASAIVVDHFAFRVTGEMFARAMTELPLKGIPVRVADHGVCNSLYLKDPDGHEVELVTYEHVGAPSKMPSNLGSAQLHDIR